MPFRLTGKHFVVTRLLYLATRGKGGVTFWFLVSKVLGLREHNWTLKQIQNLFFLFLQKVFSYEFMLELKLTDNTINDWSFCREVIIDWVVQRAKKIGGPGLTVEMDV